MFAKVLDFKTFDSRNWKVMNTFSLHYSSSQIKTNYNELEEKIKCFFT